MPLCWCPGLCLKRNNIFTRYPCSFVLFSAGWSTGSPGIVFVEGRNSSCEEYVRRLRALTWCVGVHAMISETVAGFPGSARPKSDRPTIRRPCLAVTNGLLVAGKQWRCGVKNLLYAARGKQLTV